MTSKTPITLPCGVRHYRTDGTAETWEAWDTLTAPDWTHHEWWCGPDSRRCEPDTPGARLHVHRRSMDGSVIVYPPLEPRDGAR